MPPRNLNVILVSAFIAVMCYMTHRRARTAIMVGDALDMIDRYYVDPVDKDSLLTAAMDGMTGSLDEHSSFIPGDAYESFRDSINQEFAGIGIFVEQPDSNRPVRVITPLVGSPALEAGILPDDRIIEVDDVDVSKMLLKEVSDRLKGPIGTMVKVKVRRQAGEEIAMSVGRATIELESVIGDHRDKNNKWVYRLKSQPSIAYIRLTSFGEKTVDELQSVLSRLDNDFDALVLDVRGNSGGLLYAARDISDMFIDSGRIVSTKIRGGIVEEVYDASPGTLVNKDKPVAILIDGGSASASEIVAACLQDNRRATIVGTRSYGKGTVQNILPLQFGRSALRLTVARYYRPSDQNIHRDKDATDEDVWGVTPEGENLVVVDEETLKKLSDRLREASYPLLSDSTATSDSAQADPSNTESELDYDPQLKRAYEVLMNELNPSASHQSSSPGKELIKN